MCAVIGVILKQPTEAQLLIVKRVFLESKIRGLHATGISYLKNNEIITIRESIPADQFVNRYFNNLSEFINSDGNLYLIGHCRYSTSDLEFNQPLYNKEKSIVHNGVISQEFPEKWKSIYGYDCITKNDSELILHSNNPLKEFKDMSMGVCELNTNKTLKAYRSGKRPLYITELSNGFIITSTKDIVKRSEINGIMTQVVNGAYVTLYSNLKRVDSIISLSNKDYQLC